MSSAAARNAMLAGGVVGSDCSRVLLRCLRSARARAALLPGKMEIVRCGVYYLSWRHRPTLLGELEFFFVHDKLSKNMQEEEIDFFLI